MQEFFGILALLIVFGSTVPYIFSILKGRVKPARSTRILFVLLTGAILYVQWQEFTSWILLFSAAEFIRQLVLLGLTMKHGYGGLQKVDIGSYVFFAITVAVYMATSNALAALIMLCITDVIAFVPTIVKNYRYPHLDSAIYFSLGTLAPLLSIFAASDITDIYQTMFPLYLVFINVIGAVYPLGKYELQQKKLARSAN